MPFDVEGARKHGATESDIANYLASKMPGFDVEAARTAGHSDAQITQYLQDQTAVASGPSVMDKVPSNSNVDVRSIPASGTTNRFLRGVGSGLMDLPHGAMQLMGMRTHAEEEAQRMRNAPLEATTAGKVGRIVGAGIPAVAASALVGPGAGVLWTAAKQGAIGVAQGLLSPTGNNDDRGTNALWGGGTNAIAGAATHGLSRIITPVPGVPKERLQLAETAKAHGIQPLPSQVTGSRLLRTIEGLGGKAEAIESGNQTAINKWAAALIGQPQASTLGRETLDAAYDQVDNRIRELSRTSILNTQHPNYLNAVKKLYKDYNILEPELRKELPRVADKLEMLKRWAQWGSIEGDAYQANRSMIGKLARDTKGAEQNFFSRMVDAMDEAAPKLPEWQAARSQYRNILAFDKPNVVNEFGNVKGSALWTAGRKATPEVRELASVAKAFPQERAVSNMTDAAKFVRGITSTGGGMMTGAAGGSIGSYLYGARDPQEIINSGLLYGGAGLLGSAALKRLMTSPQTGNYLSKGVVGGRNIAPYAVPLSPFGAAAKIRQLREGEQQ